MAAVGVEGARVSYEAAIRRSRGRRATASNDEVGHYAKQILNLDVAHRAHTYTGPRVAEALDCTQDRPRKEYGHTDDRRHVRGCRSVGRVVLDKLARFKSNPSRRGRESLWTATKGQPERILDELFCISGERAPNI